MNALDATLGAVLGGETPSEPGARPGVRPGLWLALALAGSAGYGGVMGLSAGLEGERLWQVAFSAVKVPTLLVVAAAICVPGFFVLNTLLGLRGDFPVVLEGLLVTQAGMGMMLAALAPYLALWYASSANYDAAVLFNAGLFAVAAGAGQGVLRRRYRPLIQRHARHRTLLRVWLGLYVFVGIQMAWVLRPFVGHPDRPVTFFREDAWGNAYVVVARLVGQVVRQAF